MLIYTLSKNIHFARTFPACGVWKSCFSICYCITYLFVTTFFSQQQKLDNLRRSARSRKLKFFPLFSNYSIPLKINVFVHVYQRLSLLARSIFLRNEISAKYLAHWKCNLSSLNYLRRTIIKDKADCSYTLIANEVFTPAMRSRWKLHAPSRSFFFLFLNDDGDQQMGYVENTRRNWLLSSSIAFNYYSQRKKASVREFFEATADERIVFLFFFSRPICIPATRVWKVLNLVNLLLLPLAGTSWGYCWMSLSDMA